MASLCVSSKRTLWSWKLIKSSPGEFFKCGLSLIQSLIACSVCSVNVAFKEPSKQAAYIWNLLKFINMNFLQSAVMLPRHRYQQSLSLVTSVPRATTLREWHPMPQIRSCRSIWSRMELVLGLSKCILRLMTWTTSSLMFSRTSTGGTSCSSTMTRQVSGQRSVTRVLHSYLWLLLVFLPMFLVY